MVSVKKLSDELSSSYAKISGKVIISIGFLLGLCFLGYMIMMFMNVFFKELFVPEISVFLSFCFLMLSYAMFFVLCYGGMVLMSRLVRKQKATLGYMLLGFQTKRITAAVWAFSGLFFLTILISAAPIFYYVDFSSQETMLSFMKDSELMKKLSRAVLVTFASSFIVIFFRFSFVWNLIYDDKEMTGLKPFIKSWRMFKGHVFQFFAYEFFICWKYLVVVFGIELFKAIFYFFTKEGLESVLANIFGIIGFITVFTMATKIAVSIPVFYDALTFKEEKSE